MTDLSPGKQVRFHVLIGEGEIDIQGRIESLDEANQTVKIRHPSGSYSLVKIENIRN